MTIENTSNIQYLYAWYNGLQIPPDFQICKPLKRLAILEMSHASLATLPDQFLRDCTDLTYFDLSENQISRMPKGVRNSLDKLIKKHTVTLDLSGNLFSCDCHEDAHGTINWIHTSKINFTNKNTYKCLGHKGYEYIIEKNLVEYEELCSESNIVLKIALLITSTCCALFSPHHSC